MTPVTQPWLSRRTARTLPRPDHERVGHGSEHRHDLGRRVIGTEETPPAIALFDSDGFRQRRPFLRLEPYAHAWAAHYHAVLGRAVAVQHERVDQRALASPLGTDNVEVAHLAKQRSDLHRHLL